MKKTLLSSAFLCLILVSSFSLVKKPTKKLALKTLDGFCNYVPSGNAVVNGDTVSVQAFYMSSMEISNLQYLEFLHHLKSSEQLEKLEIARVDSVKWSTSFKHSDMTSMKAYYHNHPAYHDFPVVNVSREGAELFCEWLSDQYDSLSGGELKLTFRIPTKAEWMRAARGNDHDRIYSWKSRTLLKSDGKAIFHGSIQANCISNGAECITRNEDGGLEYIQADYPIDYSSDGSFLIAPAKSYWPNDFGFYNMNGNVSEMISDDESAVGGDWYSPGYDVRNESSKPFNDSHPTVGFRVVATYLTPIN